jgi:septal ring factor EnvC (AmiA/AmiB activator)
MLTKEEIKEYARLQSIGAHGGYNLTALVCLEQGATWSNDQNAARIAELEAMLSKSAFDLDGHIILLQAANQQIEKERKRIAELEAQKAELEDHVTKLVDGSFKLLEQRTYLLQVYNRLAATFGIEPFDIEKDFPKK